MAAHDRSSLPRHTWQLHRGCHASAAARNTPTLLDVAYQPLYFADERALTLEDQIGAVLASPTEMGSSAERAAEHLSRDTAMRAELARVLPSRLDAASTGRAVRIALAAYLRSLDSFDSRFDRAARGDRSALTARERRGFTLFMGKARCGTCHFAPLFSGVMPPEFTSSEPEIIGVLERAVMPHARIDPDSGRAGIDHLPEHLFAFKVPTLRNIAVTAPYMHNGAYATLDDVMRLLRAWRRRRDGRAHPVHHASVKPAPAYGGRARSPIVAFLRSLTDTVTKPNAQYVALQRKCRLHALSGGRACDRTARHITARGSPWICSSTEKQRSSAGRRSASASRSRARSRARARLSIVNGRTQAHVDEALRASRKTTRTRSFVAPREISRRSDGVAAVAKHVTDVDILVNNLGGFEAKPFFEISDADWQGMWEKNVMSGVRLSRQYMRGMLSRNWGRVIFISSEAALTLSGAMLHYAVTKTAVLAAVARARGSDRRNRRHGERRSPGPHAHGGHDCVDDERREGEGDQRRRGGEELFRELSPGVADSPIR